MKNVLFLLLLISNAGFAQSKNKQANVTRYSETPQPTIKNNHPESNPDAFFTCNTWLKMPIPLTGVTIGDLDITGNQVTIEALCNPTGDFTRALVSKHKDQTDVNYFMCPEIAQITTTNGFYSINYTCGYVNNKTYHVALVYDGVTFKLYRNGFLMCQTAASGNLVTNDWPTTIGEQAWALYAGSGTFTNIFKGYINEVRIWNVARTQTQLASYMTSSLPSPTTQVGLKGYYIFNDLTNKQGNAAFNGTIHGAASINQINPNCTFVLDSCLITNACNVDFSYKQDICNPLSVQFYGLGTIPTGTYWNFGDGNIITSNSNPIHIYANTGNYIVKYGFQSGSCTDTITKTISVSVVTSNIILTPDSTICFGSSKQLRSESSLSYCWSPSTYLNDPAAQNPITSTPGPIMYYLNAEVQGANLLTNGNFNAGNTGFASDYSFAANNTTEGEYFVGSSPQGWNPALSTCTDHTSGGGNMLLVNGSPTADVRVWSQTVTVSPNTNYAFSSWIQALYPPNPAQLSFSINGSDIGNPITASLPTCTWKQFYTTWNSGSNTSALISIVNKNTIVLGNDFALDDISFAPVLIKSDSVKISIDTAKVITLPDTSICKGTPIQLTSIGAITYAWSPSAGLSSASIGNPIATPAVTTQYFVTGTNANGCTANDTVIVFVKPLPVIVTSADDTICTNQSFQLMASGGTSYTWAPPATLSNAGIPNPVASPTSNTTYTVLVTGTNTCVNTDSVKISVKTLPAFSVSGNTATCINGKAQLNATGGTSYLWSPALYLNNASIANPVATVPANTLFTVLINDSICNLSSILSTNVTTNLVPPVITASKSNDIDCVFSSVKLNATGANSYVWSPAATLSNNTIANPVATPLVTQQYTVVGTDTISLCKSQDTITIFIKGFTNPKSYIPNTFTPNGDGNNDCFRVRDFGTVKTLEIIIYNRYGNLIFQTKNRADCWDGYYKGQPAEAGNYVYYIKVSNDCGEEIQKGNLLLLR
jgi:gliding motility-associated-like protein